MARVPLGDVLDKDAYRYWDGQTWSADYTATEPILPPAVAELSVSYEAETGLWRLITLNGNADLVLRVADSPTGPWGDEQILATQAEYPGLYGGFIHPWSPSGELYFAMSIWNQYNVALMKVSLDDDGQIVRGNVLVDPSFERSGQFDVPDGWRVEGNGGIDTEQAWAKVGRRQFYVRDAEGTHLVKQRVTLQPNSRYRVTGWLKSRHRPRFSVIVMNIQSLRCCAS